MIKLVIFDFDGTLTEPGIDGNHLISKYLKKERAFRKIVTLYYAEKITGKEAVETLAHIFTGLTKNEIKMIQRQMTLRPGVFETFNALRKRKIKTAIVTGEGNQMMTSFLKMLRPDYFDGVDWVFEGDIFTGRIEWDFEYKKELPHHLINLLSLKPNEVMIVGDTWADFNGLPKGVARVAIKSMKKLPKKYCDYHISDIPVILKIIDGHALQPFSSQAATKSLLRFACTPAKTKALSAWCKAPAGTRMQRHSDVAE